MGVDRNLKSTNFLDTGRALSGRGYNNEPVGQIQNVLRYLSSAKEVGHCVAEVVAVVLKKEENGNFFIAHKQRR